MSRLVNSHIRFGLLVAVCPFATVSHAAYGQSAPQDTQVTESNEVVNSNEIIVTALKRSQALQDVPAAIAALDQDALELRGVNDLSGLQLQTPSLSFGDSLGSNQISIRGVGLTIATGAGEPGVAVHLDGAYEARPVLSSLAQFDLQRVEVLKGPQGTLYGRNATGGAINFISNPATDYFEGKVKIGYAEHDQFHGELIASGPVSDSVRARFGVSFTDRADGYLENTFPGEPDSGLARDIGLRGKLAFDLAPEAVLDVQATYLNTTGTQVYFNPVTAPLNPAVVAVNPALVGAEYYTGNSKTAVNGNFLDRTAFQQMATLTWDLGGVDLKSISAYTEIDSSSGTDADGTSAAMGFLPNDYTSDSFTQEFNLSGSTGALEWIVGAYYLTEKYKAEQNTVFDNGFFAPVPDGMGGLIAFPVFPVGAELIQRYTEDRESIAGFGDATLLITDQLSIFGGARYSHDRVEMDQYLEITGVAVTCNSVSTKVDFSAFTPRAGIQFEPNSDHNFYGSVSKGYKSGGLNFGSCQDEYDPEKVLAYEVGYKGRIADILSLGLAAFYYDYTDLQVYQLKPLTEGSGTSIENAPKATIKGIEGNFTITPSALFQIDGGVAYLDAKYDEYSNVDNANPALGLQDLEGRTITRSPEFTGTLGLQFMSPDIEGLGRATLRGEAYHSSRVYFSEFNTADQSQDSYTIYNLFLTLQTLDDAYSVRFYAKNVTDKSYLNFTTPSPLSGTTLGTYAPPRQIGAEVTFNF